MQGKRSGDGFVCHKPELLAGLARVTAARVSIVDITVARKGFMAYLGALGGGNIVKIVPQANGASDERADGTGAIKVTCGNNVATIHDGDWIDKDKTPMTLAEVRVSPHYSVTPNVGSGEFATALARLIPWAATEDNRPVLQCIRLAGEDGKLTMVTANGYGLAIETIDCDVTGDVLVSAEDVKPVIPALRKSQRVRVSIDGNGDGPHTLSIKTELIRYEWAGQVGTFPAYGKLVPSEFSVTAHLDTVDALRAAKSLANLAESGAIDLHIGDGKLTMSNPDETGQSELPADTDGEMTIRADAGYIATALQGCGGMADLKLTAPSSPMLFSANGFSVVVMPMRLPGTEAPAEAEAEQAEQTETPAEAEAEQTEQAETPAEAPAKVRASRKAKDKTPEPATVTA